MKKRVRLPKTLTTVTTFSKILAACIIFAFILGGVYAGMAYQKLVDATKFSEYLARVAMDNHSSTKVITMQDNGKDIYVHIGDVLDFQLGSLSQQWKLSFSSDILKHQQQGRGAAGQAGRYVVMKEGIVHITGTGVAHCPAGTMCPQYAMHFSATVVSEK